MLDAGMLWQVQHVDSRGRNGLHYLVRFHGLKTDVIQIACSGAAGAAAARMGYASDGPTNNELFARPSTHRLLAKLKISHITQTSQKCHKSNA